MQAKWILGCAAAAALFTGAAAQTASAGVTSVNFVAGDSLESTGVDFSGTLSYDNVAQQVTVELSNTSGFQSVITGFFFNIDGNATATYDATDDAGTTGVDESAFAFATDLAPFGTFDAGAFLGDLSNQQVKGIDEGETGQFVFDVSGADAGILAALDFFTETNDGGGLEGAFAVRYQSVGRDAEDSDKVMGVLAQPNPIPLPPAAWTGIATMGLTGLGMIRGRVRRARA